MKAVLELAQSLRMSVIAEGVETEEQAAKLWALGCKQIQGYLISKPLASLAAEAFCRESIESDALWSRVGELASARNANVQSIDSVSSIVARRR